MRIYVIHVVPSSSGCDGWQGYFFVKPSGPKHPQGRLMIGSAPGPQAWATCRPAHVRSRRDHIGGDQDPSTPQPLPRPLPASETPRSGIHPSATSRAALNASSADSRRSSSSSWSPDHRAARSVREFSPRCECRQRRVSARRDLQLSAGWRRRPQWSHRLPAWPQNAEGARPEYL